MSSTGDSCCKKVTADTCTKKHGDTSTCTLVKMCTIMTPEGEFPCECVCTCNCSSGNCDKCECKCECTLEKAQKIVNSDGTVKYRCECTCSC